MSFRGYSDEIKSEKTKPWNFSYTIFFCLCNVVSGVELPIFKSYFVKADAGQFSELLLTFWPARPVLY